MKPIAIVRNRRLAIATATLTALAALSIGAFGLRHATSQAAAPSGVPPAVPVSVAAVVEKDVVLWDEFSGRLEAVDRVDVRSRVAGAVQSVHFSEGALVKTGD